MRNYHKMTKMIPDKVVDISIMYFISWSQNYKSQHQRSNAQFDSTTALRCRSNCYASTFLFKLELLVMNDSVGSVAYNQAAISVLVEDQDHYFTRCTVEKPEPFVHPS